MSKWMTTGMWAAHLAALLGKERLRVDVARLEGRLASADKQLFDVTESIARAGQQLSNTEKRLADAESLWSATAARLKEVEDQISDLQSPPSEADAGVHTGEHVELAEDEISLRPPEDQSVLTFLSRELNAIFNVVLALFAALCLSVLVVYMNGRDEAKLLDFIVYCLSTVASIVAGGGLLIRVGSASAVEANARFYKVSALVLMCGAWVYLAMKGVAAKSFYTLAGFVAFVFSSYLMIGLDWAAIKTWRLRRTLQASFYSVLWVASVALAIIWALMVSSEHPGVQIAKEALQSLAS